MLKTYYTLNQIISCTDQLHGSVTLTSPNTDHLHRPPTQTTYRDHPHRPPTQINHADYNDDNGKDCHCVTPYKMYSTRFVGNPEGGQQCIFDLFRLFSQGGQYKLGGLRGTRGGLNPQPFRQIEH